MSEPGASAAGKAGPDGSKVAVVMVNWRAPDETLGAVTALRGQTRGADRIYIVDNGSGDDSVVRLGAALAGDPAIELIAHDRNLGFGGGCNLALRRVLDEGFDFVWLLNNDARPEADCLAELLATAERERPRVGMVGSWLTDPDQPGHDHSGSWMHPWLMHCGSVQSDHDLANRRFGWVTAASVLIRTEVLREVGIFDEAFFMYWEDADLAQRIAKAGYTARVAQNARVMHSAGTSSAAIPVQRYLWHYRSQRLWLTKHHPHPRLAKVLLAIKFHAKALLDRDWTRLRRLIAYSG